MTLDAALERFRVAEAASDIEATDEAARAVLEADDARHEVEAARARAEARATVMSALAAAAETTDKTDRDKALAKLDPKARAVFLETAPERPSLLDEAGDDWTPTPPAREWLIPGWLPAARVAMFTGEGSAGKSRLAVQVVARIASGNGVWLPGARERLTLTEPAAVVFASWEDEPDQIGRMLHGMDGRDGDPDAGELLRGIGNRLRYVAPHGSLWEPARDGSRHTSTVGELSDTGRALRDYCERWQARLLVIDPRAAAFGLNENDRALVRAFMADWDAWARAVNCAVVLVTHPPKSESAYSGSTDWHAAARSVWELAETDTVPKPKTRKAHDPRPAMQLRCIKASYAKRPAPYWLKGYPAWNVTPAERAAEWLTQVAAAGAKGTGTAPGGFNEPPPR